MLFAQVSAEKEQNSASWKAILLPTTRFVNQEDKKDTIAMGSLRNTGDISPSLRSLRRIGTNTVYIEGKLL